MDYKFQLYFMMDVITPYWDEIYHCVMFVYLITS